MGYTYADNPFAPPVTTKETVVMHNLKTLLNRLDPSNTAAVLTELLGEDGPAVSQWERERDTSLQTPKTVYLIGLSKHPPSAKSIDPSSEDGGGTVDLFGQAEDAAIAVEGKTRLSLSQSQLGRYKRALGADSYQTISWSDVYRALDTHRDRMDPYPAGLTGEFLDYLTLIDLHRPHKLAEYAWGEPAASADSASAGDDRIQDADGIGQILVRAGADASLETLEVHWHVEDADGGAKQDSRTMPWDTFTDLFDDIEQRHGQNFVDRTFVDAEPIDANLDGDDDIVIGQTQTVKDMHEGSDYVLELQYLESDEKVALRAVEPGTDGDRGKVRNAQERYSWDAHPEELQTVLTPSDRRPGFDKQFRQSLFSDRDPEAVATHLW